VNGQEDTQKQWEQQPGRNMFYRNTFYQGLVFLQMISKR
jgi:hypothetical protein